MNEKIIENWNEVIKQGDTVYHLGDIAFADLPKTDNVWRRLNGQKLLIRGNHDKQIQNTWGKVGWVKDYYELKIDDIHITLCHYPLLTWNHEARGAINLSGHTHNASWLVRPNRKGIHVGVDAWDFKPVSWEEIKAKAATIEVDLDYNKL
jgi:calcineurin-like phosphoesterase family protein